MATTNTLTLSSSPAKEPVKLDLRDKALLSILSVNSRVPISELSKKLGLNRDTTTYRINRLAKIGVIERFYAEVDFRAFGHDQYHIFMFLDQRDHAKVKALIDDLKANPATVSIIEYSDRWDLGCTMIAKSPADFDRIYTAIATAHADTILDSGVSLVISQYPTTTLPFELHKKYGYRLPEIGRQAATAKIDEHDLAILKELSKDSRAASTDIGRAVGLSPDAVINRIKGLQQDGIIIKFTIHPDWSTLGYNPYTFGMRLKSFDARHQKHVETFVHEKPYVVRALKTMGDWAMLIDILASDAEGFYKTLLEIKSEFSEIIKKYETWVAYRRLYFCPFPAILLVRDASGAPHDATSKAARHRP